ncbi:IS630 family transposase [Streptomyces sp. NPDC055103]
MSDLVGDARHLSPSAQEALRLRAVAALVAGRDREDVAAVFGVSLKAVDIWWAKWQAGGREALVMRPRGKPVGVHQVLGEAEQAAVRQTVLDHIPSGLGLSGQLWTRGQIGELIFKLYGVRSDQVTGRTWGAKGTTPIVRRTGNRFSVNAMSAISTRGRMHFMVFTESFDAKVMCRFLARIVSHFDRKVHLIVDRHSAHRSKTVRAWLAGHQDQIELHFLPSYSPELNPDELVNADLKRSLPHTHRARNQAELAAETRRFFHRRQRQPHIVRGYFGGPHVRYVLDENPLSF